jgi:hypothetical protein
MMAISTTKINIDTDNWIRWKQIPPLTLHKIVIYAVFGKERKINYSNKKGERFWRSMAKSNISVIKPPYIFNEFSFSCAHPVGLRWDPIHKILLIIHHVLMSVTALVYLGLQITASCQRSFFPGTRAILYKKSAIFMC